MRKTMTFVTALLAAMTVTLITPVHAEILKNEPKMGDPKRNRTMLVDDGTCPKGQIKRVVGRNQVKATGTKHIVRISTCVRR
jgi:hypothetical protein